MHLQPGDTIALLSTARFIDEESLKSAQSIIESWGYKTVIAENVLQQNHQFAGTDEQKALALQEAINKSNIKAIWFVRGGYGSIRCVDKVDLNPLKTNPKLFIGFSDVTVWHSLLNQMNIETLHATMLLSFKGNTPECLQQTKAMLAGQKATYQMPSNSLNIKGKVCGKLLGGNLSMLYSLTGTHILPDFTNAILFLEDLDEYLYHIDRMMQNLKYAGVLGKIKGVVVGGMSDMNDNAIPFGKTAKEIIAESIAPYNIPLAFDIPAGHIDNNNTLRLGAEHILEVTALGSTLQEQ